MKYIQKNITKTAAISAMNKNGLIVAKLDTNKLYCVRKRAVSLPNNEIWYTTDDGLKFSIGGTEVGMQGYIDIMCNPDPEEGYGCIYKGPAIVEEVFEDGMWKIKFESAVTHVGAEEDYYDDPKPGINIYPLFDGYEVGTNITSVSLPKTVTYIGATTFRSGIYMESFEVSDRVTYIGDTAFMFCGVMEGFSLTLPASITYLGKAIVRDSGAEELTYKGTIAQWNAIEKHEDWNYSGSSTDPIAIKTVHCSDGDITID